MSDNQAQAFANAMSEVPIHSMLESLGTGVADAQLALDEKSIEMTRTMADTTVSMTNSDGTTSDRSLLSLGLLPSFYYFAEANLEISFAMNMQTEDASRVAVGVDATASFGEDTTSSGGSDGGSSSSSKSAMVGMSLNFETSRKFNFSASGASKIKAKLVAVPAPSVLLEAIQANAAAAA